MNNRSAASVSMVIENDSAADRHRLLMVAGLVCLAILVLFLPKPVFAQISVPDEGDGVGVMRIPPAPAPDGDIGAQAASGSSAAGIVIDTDPGVDDAAAIAALLSLPDGPRIRGIVTVYGNATARDGANTVLNLLAAAGRTDVPLVVGAEGPYPSVGVGLHGPDGLWFQNLQNPMDVDGLPANPTRFYCRPRAGNWEGTTLLALGPLTNVAAAIERCPTVMETFDRVVSLGGAKIGGNFTPVAEYNYWQDADAAHVVTSFAAPSAFQQPPRLDTTVLPFDAFAELTFGQDLIDTLAADGNQVIQFVLPALQIYKDAQEANGIQPALPDVAALALALDSSLGSSQWALLKVMDSDDGRQVRGQTVVGLGINERLTMIADEAELADFALNSVTDPNFDVMGAIFAILARDPDNVQFVTSIDSDAILDAFVTAATTPIPVAAALPWIEGFDLPDDTQVDDGETAWRLVNDGPNPKLTAVNNRTFKIRNTASEILWTSEAVDIAGAENVSVSLDFWSPGFGYENWGPYVDYIKIYVRVDGGDLQFVRGVYGAVYGVAHAQTHGLQGETVEVIVKARSTADSEIYRFDNVTVAASDAAAASVAEDDLPAMEMGVDNTIYLPFVTE